MDRKKGGFETILETVGMAEEDKKRVRRLGKKGGRAGAGRRKGLK